MSQVLIKIEDGPDGAALVSMETPEPGKGGASAAEILANRIATAINDLWLGKVTVDPKEFQVVSKADYQRLCDRDHKLTKLENGGVDNWQWYDESMREDKEDDE